MRATKRTATAVLSTVAALTGATLLMSGPASAVQSPTQGKPSAPVSQGVAEGFASAIGDELEEAQADPGSNVLRPGKLLQPGEIVLSGNQKYAAAQLEDGNFVYGNIEDENNPKVLFATNTDGNPGAQTGMQPDGNLVVYNPDTEERLWASNTDDHPKSWLQVKDDGELSIFGQDGKHKWTYNNQIAEIGPNYNLTEWRWLSSRNRNFHLIMQDDGNLVLYNKDQKPVWSTETDGNPGAYATLQSDGNFIVFSSSNEVLWKSNTEGKGATRLTLDNNGVLAAMGEDGKSVWSANNGG